MKPTRLLLLLAILAFCAGLAVPASAHAMLLRSNPAPNAVLATSPAQVELFFSEPVAQGLSRLQVFNSSGGREDQGDMRVDPADPTRMTVSLPSLEQGVYTVNWTAVSADDGHQTQGSFTFGIGSTNTPAGPPAQPTSSASLPGSALFSKWLLLVSLAILGGRLPFFFLVWKPALKPEAAGLPGGVVHPHVWNRLVWFGLGGAGIAILLGLLAQAGQSTGAELAAPWSPAMVALLSTTRLGIIWLARLALALLAAWCAAGRPAAWKDWLGFILVLGLLFSISLTSHADTEAQPWLPVIDDWLHLVGMSLWLGGLAYLLTGLRALVPLEPRLRTRLTSRSMGRFSGMALASVGVIGLTGLYSASLRVGTLQALLTSIYGHALLVKQIFVAALLALAGVNLLVLSPRLKKSRLGGEANPALVNRFRKTVLVEAVLGAMLLMAVSLLTYLPPAKASPLSQGLHRSMRVDDLRLDLTITPGQVGQNTFQLYVTSKGIPLEATVEQVLLRFTSRSANIAQSEGELISRGNGIFATKGTFLSLAGKWQVQAVVRRADKFDAFANFNLSLPKPGDANPQAATPRIAGILFLGMAVVAALLVLALPFRAGTRLAAAILPTLLLLGVGVYFLILPVKVTPSQANPVAPDQQSILAGKSVYTQYCLHCHGVTGQGDGPDGLGLNPRPADLVLHGVPGVHTDAQLFDWITNGLPGTRMPAWKDKISDTGRWDLVNYIRYLAQNSQPVSP